MDLFSCPDFPARCVDCDDQSLVERLRTLASHERALRAELIVHLAELDARQLCRPAGFPSTFAWLTDHLRFSKAPAAKD